MTKIITSESDVELDPESLTDSNDLAAALENNNLKRLEAIRDLDALLNEDSIVNTNNVSREEAIVKCVLKFESRLTKNAFATNVYLTSLNQTVVDRNITEIEIHGEDRKLIQLFSFYQNNVYKQKRSKNGPARILLQKRGVTRRRKKFVLTKNDVFVTKFYAIVKNKKINLIDLQHIWKVNELKYAFDNNRSTIKMLLVRSK